MTERIFIAVPLQKDVQSALNHWSHQLQAQIFFQKQTYWQDYHITLKFLGDVDSAMIPAISGTLQKIAEQNSSFSIQVNSIGTFGTETAPRILFANVESDLGALEQLQNQVEQAMLQHGFALENRPYHPHITLARKYSSIERFSLSQAQQTLLDPFIVTAAKEIVLYRTQLGHTPMYEEADTFPLH